MPEPSRTIPSFTQMLDAVPTRNVRVAVERHGPEMLLRIPVAPRWYLTNPLSWALLPQKKERKIALDAVGREIWDACDGRNTVEQIAEVFAQRHRLRFHAARLSVSAFLRDLTERGAVVIVVPPHAKDCQPQTTPSPGHSRRDVRRMPARSLAMEGVA